jgi:hypothetical protein
MHKYLLAESGYLCFLLLRNQRIILQTLTDCDCSLKNEYTKFGEEPVIY